MCLPGGATEGSVSVGNHHVDIGTAREVAVLGVVVSPLHVFDARRNGNRAAQVRAGSGHTFEIGQGVERHVHFAGGTAELIAINFFEKFCGQVALVDKLSERQPRIDARGNDVGVDFVAVGEHHAFGLAVFHNDLSDTGFSANLRAGFPGGIADRIGNCAGAAAGESPGAESAVDLTHVMMEQNVSRTRRADAEECADDAGS